MPLPKAINMEIETKFEGLKKEYVTNMEHLVNTLQGLRFDDLQNIATRAELALAQSQSSTSFMTLCKFVFENSIDKEVVKR